MNEVPKLSRRSNVRLRDFSRSLPMSLLKAREAVMQRFRSSLRLYDLTEQQWRVLRALASVYEIEAAALAKVTFLLPPSLSRILRDLEERALIERRSDSRDARRSILSISPSGLKLMNEVAPHSEAIYKEITDAFGAEKLDTLQRLLKELRDIVLALDPVERSESDAERAVESKPEGAIL